MKRIAALTAATIGLLAIPTAAMASTGSSGGSGANHCARQTLTFSVAADSSAITQVSGPQLSPTQEFTYDGSTYTIMTINPGADQFSAFVDNFLFTNGGTAITNATGVLVCSSH
jgi:hypothetical protein